MYEVNIDFDEASREWRKNKKHNGKGSFVYTCNYTHTNGKQCNKPVEKEKTNKYLTHANWTNKNMLLSDTYCKQHAYVTRNGKRNFE
jgi:hypothetical protein